MQVVTNICIRIKLEKFMAVHMYLVLYTKFNFSGIISISEVQFE